jgi:O-antigen/teichoic acid export membrane protein
MKNVLHNLVVLAIGDVGSKILGFIAVAFIARTLGPENFGFINIGLAVLGYLILVSSPGVHLYGTRSVAAGEIDTAQIVVSITGVRLVLSILLITVILILSVVFSSLSPALLLVVLFAISLLPLSISLDWYFQGKEQMGVITWSRLILNGLYVSFLLLVVRGSGDSIWVPVAFLAGNFGASIYLFFAWTGAEDISRLRELIRWRSIWSTGKDLILTSIPLGLGSTLAQVAFHFPPLLLGLFLGPEAVGQYSAAMRIVFALMIVDRVTSIVFFPVAARFWNSDRQKLSFVSNQFTRMIISLTLPVCLVSFFLAPDLVRAIYGPDYGGAVNVLRVLIWFFLSTSVNTIFLFGLMGIGQEGRYAKIMLWGTTVQVGLMVALAYLLGTTGVAVGFVAGEFLISAISFNEYHKVIPVNLFRAIVKPVFSSIIMRFFLFIRPLDSLLPNLLIAFAVFLVTLFLVGGVSRDDITLLRQEI